MMAYTKTVSASAHTLQQLTECAHIDVFLEAQAGACTQSNRAKVWLVMRWGRGESRVRYARGQNSPLGPALQNILIFQTLHRRQCVILVE